MKIKMRIHSLGGELAEVEYIERIADNVHKVKYNDNYYTAIYNIFTGCYYVDDIYGAL